MTRPFGVVVIAASAGSLRPLREIAASLTPDFPAAIVVANHTARTRSSLLPMILSAEGLLPAMRARDRQPLEPGRILVASPDRHLRITRDRQVRVTQYPADTIVRPSADVLFASAAETFGPRAVGIVLSGSGGDGALGLAMIRAAGGTAVVQSPDDAEWPSMPRVALATVTPDACVPAGEIVAVVGRLLRARLKERRRPRARRKARPGKSEAKALAAALRLARASGPKPRPPPSSAPAFQRTAEKWKELRNLLMKSRAWLRNHSTGADRQMVEEIEASMRSVRDSRKAVDRSREILTRTRSAVTESSSRKTTANEVGRSWGRGKRPSP